MFCMNCGTQLPEDAKFCFKCGANVQKISSEKDKVTGATLSDKVLPKPTITLHIGKWELKYPESIKTYVDSYTFFADLANSETDKFEQYYKNAGISCIEDVLDKGVSIFITQIQGVLQIAFNRLLKFGVDTLTPSMYLDVIVGYYNPEVVFQPFQKSADAIFDFASRLANMRDAEKMMRGKWVGGGFGIKSAIKGAVKAGVLNIGTSALRGIGDTVTNVSDKAKLDQIRAAAFPNDTCKRLADGIFSFVIAIHDAEMTVLIQNGLVEKITFDAGKEKIQLSNRVNSINGQNMEPLYQAAIAALQADPFDLEIYKTVYNVARVADKINNDFTGMVSDLFAFSEFFGLLKYCKKIFTEIDTKVAKSTLERLAAHPDTIEQNFNDYVETVQMLKEQNPYFNADEAIDAGKQYRDKIANAYKQVNQELVQEKNFKTHYANLMSMIQRGDIPAIWSLAKNEDSLAQYALMEYYEKEVLRDAINKGDIREFDTVIRSICETYNGSDVFTQFLTNHLTYTMYSRDRRSTYRVNAALNAIEKLSDSGNCVSVMAFVGYFLTSSNKEYDEEGIKNIMGAVERLHPLALAWYGSYLLEGSHGVKTDKRLATYYLGLAVYANQGYALKLNEKYHLDLMTYQADLESQKEDLEYCIYDEQQYFIRSNSGIILTQIPKPLVEKYKDRFKASPKDIIMTDGTELETTNNLLYTRKSFQIPPLEKIYFVVAANLFGHFKENMQGLAVGSNGIYTNGGAFSFKGLMPWDKFGKSKIYVKNGLKIGDLAIITPLDKMLEAFFKDLYKIFEADMGQKNRPAAIKSNVENQQTPIASQNLKPVEVEEEGSISAGIVCPSCRKLNKAGKRFCSQCGTSLSPDQLCPQCGAKLRPGKKFCSGCGAKIE